MKNKLLLSATVIGFCIAFISCTKQGFLLEEINLNEKSDSVNLIQKIKKEGRYNFLISDKNTRIIEYSYPLYPGLEYRFTNVPSYEVCCDMDGKRTTYITVTNRPPFGNDILGLVIVIAVQKNMDRRSLNVPTVSSTNGVFNFYRWYLPSVPVGASFTAQLDTEFNDSSVEGLIGVFLQDGNVSFCNGTLLNLIHNAYGTCVEDNRPYPGCPSSDPSDF